MCQQKKKPSTRISLTKKVGQVSVSNSWNDREFDDSSNSNSNSNSLDDVPMMDDSNLPTLKDKSKLTIKTEPDDLKNEIDETQNRRRKNRSLKSNIIDETIQSDDDKSLNMGWTADETIKKEEISSSPINHANASDSNGSNAVSGVEIKTEEPNGIKDEKRTRTTNTGSQKATRASDPKPKLTSSHCKYCFKKFSNASNLRRHITMSHFGPKNFSCNLCTFRGRRKSDILGHMRTKHDNERTSSLKFVQVNDKPTPKPKPQSQGSFSRRKDKHTEVLQDDQEEIYIDSEAFVVEESTDQFKLSLDPSYENSNIDGAIDNANETTTETLTEETTKQNSNLKRKGRPKANEPVVKKVNRSPAPVDKKECKSVPTRRPVRNRIMPVKKDFVYDLSTLLKKDYKDFQDDTPSLAQQEPQPQSPQPQPSLSSSSSSSPAPSPSPSPSPTQTPTPSPSPSSSLQLPLTQQQNKSNNVSPAKIDNKTSKRRHILPNATDSKDNSELPADQIKNESQKHSPPPETSQKIENPSNQNANDSNSIKGAADTMAQQAVKANRAAFFKPPDLPTERPVTMPQRQFDTGTMKDWPLLKSPSAIFANYKSKLSNLKVPGLKRKKRSCLLKNHKNRLHDKHNKIEANGTHTAADADRFKSNDTEQPIPEIMKISSKLVDKIQLQCVKIESDAIKTVQSNNEVPANNKQPECVQTTTTPRRMTLLERLAENKTKKLNESLSRMTIANSDNDSDDD